MEEHTVEVSYEDGRKESLTVRAMPVARYPKAIRFARGDGFDELGLLDLAFNQKPGWALTLAPDSLTAASEVMYAANPCFFAYAARVAAWGRAVASPSTSQT